MLRMSFAFAGIGTVLFLLGTGPAAHGEILEFGAVINGICAHTNSPATGVGYFTLDTDSGLFSYNITHDPLPSGESAAHIHGPNADPCSNARSGVILITLPMGSPKIGSVVLSASDQADLIAELLYVNIHSEEFPNGEIKGVIMQGVPTPAAATWGLVVMVALIMSAGTILVRSRSPDGGV